MIKCDNCEAPLRDKSDEIRCPSANCEQRYCPHCVPVWCNSCGKLIGPDPTVKLDNKSLDQNIVTNDDKSDLQTRLNKAESLLKKIQIQMDKDPDGWGSFMIELDNYFK